MKLQTTILLFVLFLAASCADEAKTKSTSTTAETPSIYTGPIIDMHIHAYTQEAGLFGFTHPPTLRGETYEGTKNMAEHLEATISKFREHNIVKAVVTNGQAWQDEFPDLILVAGANREIDALKQQYKEGELQAIAEMTPFYAGILADDPSQIPYFELAEELGIPVGFHVFPGGPNYGIHLMPEMLGGMRTYNANPLQLEKALVEYPNLKLYIMHGGWPYVEDVKALMYAHPNVYVDIAVTNWILPQKEFNNYLESLFDAGFGNRIMYGSDQMVWPDVISVGIESVNNADFLTLDQKEDIFFDNAAAFLGLSKTEITELKSL